MSIFTVNQPQQPGYAQPQQPMAYAPPTTFAQPQPMYVPPPQVVPVQPVVVVQHPTSSSQFGQFLNDVDRSFQNSFGPRYVVPVAVAQNPNMRVGQCAACMTPLQYQFVGMPVQVKCYRCPNVNVFN